jgi:hypothetical protein
MEPVRCANCQSLQRRVDHLQAENERLRRQLDEATRAGKRQAAPFAKGEPKPNHRRPGRKPGKDCGTKARRQPPSPEQINEVHEAPLGGTPSSLIATTGITRSSHGAACHQSSPTTPPIFPGRIRRRSPAGRSFLLVRRKAMALATVSGRSWRPASRRPSARSGVAVGRGAGAVGPDVGVADVLAAGAFGTGLPKYLMADDL